MGKINQLGNSPQCPLDSWLTWMHTKILCLEVEALKARHTREQNVSYVVL